MSADDVPRCPGCSSPLCLDHDPEGASDLLEALRQSWTPDRWPSR